MVDPAWLSQVDASLNRAEGIVAHGNLDADSVEALLFPHIKTGYLWLQELGIICDFGVQEVFNYLDRMNEYDFRSFPFLSKILRDLSYHVGEKSQGLLKGYAIRVDKIEEALG